MNELPEPSDERAAVMTTLGFTQGSTDQPNTCAWSYWNGDRRDPAHGFAILLAPEAKPAASWVVAEIITRAVRIGEQRRGQAIQAQLKALLS